MRGLFEVLLQTYGPQHWWPADTPFEVMVGAVLTQNTSWTNVERALARLREKHALDADAILAMDPAELAETLTPVGYFNVKARRLRAFCDFYRAAGGLDALGAMETQALRSVLLGIHGVGPETADDILLYAFDRPVFVVDAYTRRIFARIGLLAGDEGYEQIRLGLEDALGPDVALFREYHGLLVRHGKDTCKTRPNCAACCLNAQCAAAC